MAISGRAIRPQDIVESVRPFLSNIRRHALQTGMPQCDKSVRVGLCVSGGPDSMALAHLINNLPAIESVKLSPFAIIVDHQVRQESTEEALQVQAELHKLGIPALKVGLSWPPGIKPSDWPDFETQARTRRYRIIALTALHNQAYHVFTGHHFDDQIETGIMRLVSRNHTNLFGLRSIPYSSSIPCCDDIQGAHEHPIFWQKGTNSYSHPNYSTQEVLDDQFDLRLPSDDGRTFFRPGGLMLHRPLLPFRKADLVATCLENEIPFVTDATNADPKFTMRNAVRILRASQQLPKALGSDRILELQQHAEAQTQRCYSNGLHYLQSFQIQKLDMTSGILVVRLPQLQNLDKEQIRGLSNAVVRLTQIVAPCSRDAIPMQAGQNVLESLFPSVFTSDDDDATKIMPARKKLRNSFNFLLTHFAQHADKKDTWTLCRQPMRPSEVADLSELLVLDKNNDANSHSNEMFWSKWKLWDNRFWIRVSCRDRQELESIQIRPLTDIHIQQLRLALTERKSAKASAMLSNLRSVLSMSAPGKTRFTLPILEINGQVIELPTLGLNFNDPSSPPEKVTRSQVAYKSIEDIDQLRMIRHKIEGGRDVVTPTRLSHILNLEPAMQATEKARLR